MAGNNDIWRQLSMIILAFYLDKDKTLSIFNFQEVFLQNSDWLVIKANGCRKAGTRYYSSAIWTLNAVKIVLFKYIWKQISGIWREFLIREWQIFTTSGKRQIDHKAFTRACDFMGGTTSIMIKELMFFNHRPLATKQNTKRWQMCFLRKQSAAMFCSWNGLPVYRWLRIRVFFSEIRYPQAFSESIYLIA